MTVVTRFAPSPTGYLHIGGARTALFNWLFARHHKGTFHLRIEDTDRERSTPEATQAILDGMKWLGLQWDGDPIYQFARGARHAEVAHELIKRGQAYYCYCTPQELTEMREQAQKAGKGFRYDARWRDRDPKEAPQGVKPAVRIKAPTEGAITVHDLVQGEITVGSEELDDMVLLRSDGTPTYMLAVVVDDHDMGITNVIRGQDHLTNTFRQLMIYNAMGWKAPDFAHIPLIHGADGAKLSKRHGALAVQEYEKMGYLPEAVRNYLLRLGWAHGDDEIISTEQAIQWFGLEAAGTSPSRFDFTKLESLNGHYIREADNERLADLIIPRLGVPVDAAGRARLVKGMPGLKQRAKTLVDLAESAKFYVTRDIAPDAKTLQLLNTDARALIAALLPALQAIAPGEWQAARLEQEARGFAEARGLKLGGVAQPLRAALTFSTTSPPIFEVLEVLAKEESLGRLHNVC
jgi:glutamyl-tRNA synthetase